MLKIDSCSFHFSESIKFSIKGTFFLFKKNKILSFLIYLKVLLNGKKLFYWKILISPSSKIIRSMVCPASFGKFRKVAVWSHSCLHFMKCMYTCVNFTVKLIKTKQKKFLNIQKSKQQLTFVTQQRC